ncbi:carboxypeptidase-like regulatory domain-containing protein [Mucilaginibacter sp. KACC 22773]|uniref:carboxypeptidase-like regulatory domain-containing protein n=1 Tax=Mucilaginibacter sp. KACC 22773 TaxID=3025671 RepID=UPI002365ABF0|nr:carboxypeptidase-like regulatory domain-containing protein [Mucilaginibacter sp. KACC 22773]WDF77451.1 carboxypeptidase-like regulatory domain-containing protein [Mucilaginibacter sp. KACC 22773]
MNTKKADILQVRKYLNGELDAKAMHRLEHDALDDPFLMDALEGFESAPKDQQANLADLTARLQQRTEQKKGRVISWQVWSIAASVLIVLTIGGLWIKRNSPEQAKQLAELQKDKTQVVDKDTVATPPHHSTQETLMANNAAKQPVLTSADRPTATRKYAAGKSVYQQEISADDNKSAAPAGDVFKKVPQVAEPATEPKQENSSISEMVVMNYTDSKAKADSLALLAKKAREKASNPVESKLTGKVAGLEVITSKDAKTQFGYSSINGLIIGKGDNMPVVGAAIRIQGTNKSTVTDVNGYFSMPVTKNNETLDIASIGYQPRQVSVKRGDSLKVVLNPDNDALAEVTVAGNDKVSKTVAAHPQGEMAGLKKYLQANATVPEGDATGTVSVLFTVNTDGTLSDFKIKKSLSAVADQKAIDLIKAGPTWVGNSNGKPEQVTVKVKFATK